MAKFSLSRADLLDILNQTRKNLLDESQVFGEQIKLSHLKQIDKIFQKGLAFYHDPSDLRRLASDSIFFRKDVFNSELNLTARTIVSKYEEEKTELETLCKLLDFKLSRKIPVYSVSDAPQQVAHDVRNMLYPRFKQKKKDFLAALIAQLAAANILVFEHVEHHARHEKANINGFFLKPNVLVIKRHPKSFSREIFTLAHELGHYLLNQEELDDSIGYEEISHSNLSEVEKWCNDFAYYFLVGTHAEVLRKLDFATRENDFHSTVLDTIAIQTHVSKLALYTRLLIDKKISFLDYNYQKQLILASIQENEAQELERQNAEKELAELEGRSVPPFRAKPIVSPLYKDALAVALRVGALSESEFCKKLGIDSQNLDKYYQ